MKSNNKAFELIESGLSEKTVSKLTDAQINTLYDKLIKEQVTQTKKQVVMTKIPQSTARATGANVHGVDIKMDQSNNIIATQTENNQELGETKKSNPWAICTSTLSKEFGTSERSSWTKGQKNKYERCVKDVKKSLKEGKKPLSLFLENEIMRLVEKHIPPKITKKDLIQFLNEAPEVAPAEPKTKPDVKPTIKPGTRPSHPGKNPNPGEHPAPKAGRSDVEVAPAKPTTKPDVSPTTKPGTRPSHPGKNPNPGEHPAPKAGKISPEDAKEKIIDVILSIIKE